MIHGGDVYTEGILKGKELLDFSSNINPLGVPKSFSSNINEALEGVTRYPDVRYRETFNNLEQYIQKSYGISFISADNFVLGNGAAEIIDLTISCFKKLLIVVPSFAEYELNAKKWGCCIEYFYLDENMKLNYEKLSERIESNDAIIIGNPNNPNGNVICKNKFKKILDFCEESRKIVIIDEAFIEFTGNRNHSFVKEIKSYKCLILVRALTKFYGMPGVRLGYGISRNEELLSKIRGKQNPWNINCFAELAAKYVLKDEEYIKSSLDWIEEERRFLVDELNKINFIDKTYETYSNFVLCRLKGISCEELYSKCLIKGILIRKANNFKGLDEKYIRLAIKDRKKNLELIKVLKYII